MSETIGTFEVRVNGKLVAAGDNRVVSSGVVLVLKGLAARGKDVYVTREWPRDKDGCPLDLDMDTKTHECRFIENKEQT